VVNLLPKSERARLRERSSDSSRARAADRER
jgi:hypothetical protein